MKLSGSQEDYLKAIWYLEKERRRATAKTVAEACEVRPPTVLSMFRILSRMGLITYNRSQGACLTEKGEQLARKLVRKHRLIETFLEQVLKMDGGVLHEEAEKLEHVVSDQLMHRIDAYLGYPSKDPHGSPIPLLVEKKDLISLEKVGEDSSFIVKEINLKADMVSYYAEHELKNGSVWMMNARVPDESSFLLTNGRRFVSVSAEAARSILVMVNT